MRTIRRLLRVFLTFLSHVFGSLVQAVVTSLVVGVFVISAMHYMGVPIPSAIDLLRGVSRLAHALS